MKKTWAALMAGIAIGALGATPAVLARDHEKKQEREYRYVYYPAQQLYYATEQQIWFWMNGSSWNFGVHLPKQYRKHRSTGVPVMLRTRRPYAQHVYVEKRYGRPWRERHSSKHAQRHKQ